MKKWTVVLVTKEYHEVEVEAVDYDAAITAAIEAGIETQQPYDTGDAEWFAAEIKEVRHDQE